LLCTQQESQKLDLQLRFHQQKVSAYKKRLRDELCRLRQQLHTSAYFYRHFPSYGPCCFARMHARISLLTNGIRRELARITELRQGGICEGHEGWAVGRCPSILGRVWVKGVSSEKNWKFLWKLRDLRHVCMLIKTSRPTSIFSTCKNCTHLLTGGHSPLPLPSSDYSLVLAISFHRVCFHYSAVATIFSYNTIQTLFTRVSHARCHFLPAAYHTSCHSVIIIRRSDQTV